MAHLSINLLGSFEITIDNKPISGLESAKVLALLVYLAVESQRPHTRESLVGLLWPEAPEESARHNLRQALFNLRSILGKDDPGSPYLIITRDKIQFNPQSDCSLDVDLFNQHYHAWQAELNLPGKPTPARVAELEMMTRLYRGEFLHQFSLEDSSEFEQWTLVLRENFHQRVLEAHRWLADYYERQSDFQAARRHASRQLELDPWREEAHRQLMRVLALDGQRSVALAQFDICRRTLARELDVEPAPETRELYEQIRLGTLTTQPGVQADGQSAPINNLPVQLTPFIGREAELARLGELINDPECRCISLTGPGGIGKTRLAIHATTEQINHFSDGVAFIPLASVESTPGVILAISNAINLSLYTPGDRKDYLLSYLRNRHMLLILDNIEHLLAEDSQPDNLAQLLLEILRISPGIKLLITTREALNILGEWIFDVQGLSVPDNLDTQDFDEFDAIALFIQRARRISPQFSVSDLNRADIAHICRLVGGMPLAIELAATWIRVLSPAEINLEIEKNLDFLSASTRDLPERHRSMRVVFDHSWEMLSAEEQDVFSRLSIFRGGFPRQAAEQVAGATLSILSTLVNRTLLRRTAAGRYDLHELVRQYGARRLAQDPLAKEETQRLHYEFFLNLAQAAEVGLKGADQLEWLGRLEQEHDNYRVALQWALDENITSVDDGERALRLSAALRWFWRMHGHFHEGRSWLREALRRCPGKSTPACAGAILGACLLENALGELSQALILAREAVALYRKLGDLGYLAEALMLEGLTLLWQGEAAPGQSSTREALEIYRKVGDRWGEAQALYRLGSSLADYGGDPVGRAMLRESAAIMEELGEKYLLTSVLISIGMIDISLGDYKAAQAQLEHSLATTREIKHPWGIADALTNLGCIQRIYGEYEAAQARFEEALQVYGERGSIIWETDVHCAMAETAICQGDLSMAHFHLRAASDLLGISENKWLQVLVLYFRGLLAFYEGDLESAAGLLEETVSRSREGHFKPDLARASVTLGRVMLKMGNVRRASELLHDALGLYWESSNKLGIATAFEALASLRFFQADTAGAVALHAAAHSLRQALHAPLPPIDRPASDSDLAAARTETGEAVFTGIWTNAASRPYEDIVQEMLQGSQALP